MSLSLPETNNDDYILISLCWNMNSVVECLNIAWRYKFCHILELFLDIEYKTDVLSLSRETKIVFHIQTQAQYLSIYTSACCPSGY